MPVDGAQGSNRAGSITSPQKSRSPQRNTVNGELVGTKNSPYTSGVSLGGKMPVLSLAQKKQAWQQNKQAAQDAAHEFDDRWCALLLGVAGTLEKEAPVRRVYFHELKQTSFTENPVGMLNFVIKKHDEIRRLDCEASYIFLASKQRDKIEEHLELLRPLDETYQWIGAQYEWRAHSYTEKLEELDSNDELKLKLTSNGTVSKIKETIDAQKILIEKIHDLRVCLREEQDRLMSMLNELPSRQPDKPSRRMKSSSQVFKRPPERPAKAKSSKAAGAKPTNLIEFTTLADNDSGNVKTLSGKPCKDNPDVVYTLDRNGQRTATYHRSPNRQLYVKYEPAIRVSGAATSTRTLSLSELEKHQQDRMSEVGRCRKKGQYSLRQSKWSPVGVYADFECQANRLRAFADEVEESKQGLCDAGDQKRAGEMADTLKAEATKLVEEGENIRLEMTVHAAPIIAHLEYLYELNLLQITQTIHRKPLERAVSYSVANKPIKEPDYLDEFEIWVKVKGTPMLWALAHMHYPANDTAPGCFNNAHLKRPEQKHDTGKGIHYGEFCQRLYSKFFLKASVKPHAD